MWSLYGGTPLWYASQKGHDLTVKLLLADRRVNPNSQDPKYGTTPLWWAAKNGHETIVRLLLEKDSLEPDRSNNMMPLLIATWKGHSNIVRLLLGDKRINPNIKITYNNDAKATPLLLDMQ